MNSNFCLKLSSPYSPSPKFYICIGIDKISHQLHCITIHMLLAARFAIVCHWKTPDSISRNEVSTLVWAYVCCMRVIWFLLIRTGYTGLIGTTKHSIMHLKVSLLLLVPLALWIFRTFHPVLLFFLGTVVLCVQEEFNSCQHIFVALHGWIKFVWNKPSGQKSFTLEASPVIPVWYPLCARKALSCSPPTKVYQQIHPQHLHGEHSS